LPGIGADRSRAPSIGGRQAITFAAQEHTSALSRRAERRRGGARLSSYSHWLALAPSIALLAVFIYGFIGWTAYISLSASRMTPDLTFVGLRNYQKLWRLDPWMVASENAVIFTALYVALGMAVGLGLAILLDQRVRFEGVFRTLFLYPAALSLVVTGVVWKWMLNPGTGVESFVRNLGFSRFKFDWIIDSQMAIYALVIAGVWQVAGFAMALFLAAMRGVDDEVLRAARLDGASALAVYRHIVLPAIGPTFVTVAVLLTAFALKTFDLVVAMTAGGPGYASVMPATFMFDMAFWRNQLGVSAASAITLLVFSLAVISPYLFSRTGRVGDRS
jgi:glucose/mannose transport system permease protein